MAALMSFYASQKEFYVRWKIENFKKYCGS